MQNGPFALTGHMVKIRRTVWQKSVVSSTGTSRIKKSQGWNSFVRIYHILLPSSMANFVPCDQFMQKAHFLELFFSLVAHHVPQTVNTVGKRNFKFARFI